MKRFLLFSGELYYPDGGFKDFKGAFDTLEEATPAKDDDGGNGFGWWQVVDIETGTMTCGGELDDHIWTEPVPDWPVNEKLEGEAN